MARFGSQLTKLADNMEREVYSDQWEEHLKAHPEVPRKKRKPVPKMYDEKLGPVASELYKHRK